MAKGDALHFPPTCLASILVMYVQAVVDNLNKWFLDLHVSDKSKVFIPKYDPSDEEICITNHCSV